MDIDLLQLLKRRVDDTKLGYVAKEALWFTEGSECKFLQTPGPGQSSQAVVRMYEIRKTLKKFERDAFIGLEESIQSLSERDVTVHLSVIETDKGVISVWLEDHSDSPVGIVIAKFLSLTE